MKIIDKIKEMVMADNSRGEMLRFVIVGGLATVLQYAIYLALVLPTDIPDWVAVPISYVISLCFNLWLSGRFTFRAEVTARRSVGFVICHLINMCLQTGFTQMFSIIVPEAYALLPALLLCIPINFCMVRFVFHHNDKLPKKEDKAQAFTDEKE